MSKGARSVFVTGAARGIGRATAELFHREGYLVGAFDRDADALRDLEKSLGSERLVTGVLDVTESGDFEATAARFASRAGGGLSVLVNNAGLLRMGAFEALPLEDYRRLVDVNVHGVIHGIRACLPYLEKSRGTIVNLSSVSAIYGGPELAVYSATKFAVRALTEALDLEFSARGVRVVDVMPGYVDTEMVSSQTYRAKSLKTVGIKLAPEDVARAVMQAAERATGHVHHVPQRDMGALLRMSTLFPRVSRRLMKHFSKM